MKSHFFSGTVLALAALAAACGSGGSQGGKKIVLGALFADDIDELSRLELYAVRLAAEHINASGAFSLPLEVVNRSPAWGDVIDPERVERAVKDLYDLDKAVAFVSGHGGDNSNVQNRVTNQPEYSTFVRCANTAMEGTSNMPGFPDFDETDCFYRMVVDMSHHIDFGAVFFLEKSLFDIALIRMNDDAGTTASFYVQMKIGEMASHGFEFVKDMAIPPGAFVLEDNRAKLDELILLSQEDKVDVTIIVTYQAQTNGVIKYLTENGLRSAIVLDTASTTSDLFAIATGIPDWLNQAGNVIYTIAPDNYGGPHGGQFLQEFRDRFQEEPSPYSPTAYECAVTLALAMLYAGDDQPQSAGVKQNMFRFKAAERTQDEVEVGIGASEFARAAQLIGEGKRVNFVGSSGRIIFDENGDRPSQGMCVLGPNAGVTAWETKECYDENYQKR